MSLSKNRLLWSNFQIFFCNKEYCFCQKLLFCIFLTILKIIGWKKNSWHETSQNVTKMFDNWKFCRKLTRVNQLTIKISFIFTKKLFEIFLLNPIWRYLLPSIMFAKFPQIFCIEKNVSYLNEPIIKSRDLLDKSPQFKSSKFFVPSLKNV